MRRRWLRRCAHRKANVIRAKLDPADRLAVSVGHGQKSLDQILIETSGYGFQGMKNRSNGEYLRTFPARERRACVDPFTTGEFPVNAYMRVLFERAVDKEKPGVESSGAEWRRYPAANEGEIVCVKIKIIVRQEGRPGHARRLKVIKQRSALPLR